METKEDTDICWSENKSKGNNLPHKELVSWPREFYLFTPKF